MFLFLATYELLVGSEAYWNINEKSMTQKEGVKDHKLIALKIINKQLIKMTIKEVWKLPYLDFQILKLLFLFFPKKREEFFGFIILHRTA